MRLGDDDRARVPFAILGVLLLVGSATLSATLHDRPEPATPDSTVAMDRVTAETQTAVRSAVVRASHDAAREPVVEPANTAYGDVIDEETPFRDYLRIRIYLAARTSLERVHREDGSYRANASLAPTPNASALRDAKERVHVRSAGEAGSALHVRIENVTVTLRRDGAVVDRRTETVSLTVPTPVLALHDRVSEYEERLDRGPLEGPGLGRRLSARLYAVAWARGYGQYGGAPIQNVVTNRHVELMTNGAALSTQRAVFGRSDPGGRAAMRRGTKRVGLTDVLAGTRLDEDRWTDVVLAAEDERRRDAPGIPGATAIDGPEPNATLSVGVNLTADRAFASLVLRGRDGSAATLVESLYTVETMLAVDTSQREGDGVPAPDRPGDNWTLVDESRDRTATVRNASAGGADVPGGWHEFETYGRDVEWNGTVVRRWTNGTETRVTRANWTETYRVELAVAGEHPTSEFAPRRGLSTVYEPGGSLDGRNLADVRERAVRELVTERGGPDALARRVSVGRVGTERTSMEGERPPDLDDWLYRDLAGLRDRVRNVSVTVPRGALATGDANPPAMLAEELRDRRKELVDPPETYGSVPDKARIAVRRAYVDRTIAELEQRAEETEQTQREFDAALAERSPASPDRLAGILDARTDATDPERRPLATDGPGGRLTVAVDGSPTYLTLSAIESDEAAPIDDEYHPLVARNLNVFTVPYDDAAEGIVGGVLGSDERVSLETAARSLRAADRAAAATDNETVEAERDELEASVDRSVVAIQRKLRLELLLSTDLSEAERNAAIDEGFARWNTTASKALAAANGSAPRAVAAAAHRRTNVSERERDLLRLRLRTTTAAAVRSETVRPSKPPVDRTTRAVRHVRREKMEDVVSSGLENATDRIHERWIGDAAVTVPSGLPLTPVPGYWYATANVWYVETRGEYARFTVRGNRGAPATDGGEITYTRDGSAVSVDVTGDGSEELLGHSRRISFGVSTAVLVVVPPGGKGVGDVDGTADERSDGWPDPGWSNERRGRSNKPHLGSASTEGNALRRDRKSLGDDPR